MALTTDRLTVFLSAENLPDSEKAAANEGVHDIRVKEVLEIGLYPIEVAIIKDSNEKIWLIFETNGHHDKLLGLVSRYNVRPGTKLKLIVSKFRTQCFSIDPELSMEHVDMS